MKRTLVLYSKTSHGRQKLAENISAALALDGSSVDAVDYVELETVFGRMEDWKHALVKYLPGVWDFVYNSPLFHKLGRALREGMVVAHSARLEKLLVDNKYELVLASPDVASVVSYLKKKNWYQGKLVVYFSEFHFHPLWLYENADLYLATIVEQREQMLGLGVSNEKMVVIGVTVPEKVNMEQEKIVSLQESLEIAEGQKVVLVVGGDDGFGINNGLINEVQNTGAKVLVICGENEPLRNKVKQDFSYDKNVLPLGFVENMDELYSIADVLVTIPSAMVVAEALRYQLPIIITGTFTSGGRENYSYLTDKFLVFPDFVDVRGAVEDELATGNFKRDLAANPNIDLVVQHGSTLRVEISKM